MVVPTKEYKGGSNRSQREREVKCCTIMRESPGGPSVRTTVGMDVFDNCCHSPFQNLELSRLAARPAALALAPDVPCHGMNQFLGSASFVCRSLVQREAQQARTADILEAKAQPASGCSCLREGHQDGNANMAMVALLCNTSALNIRTVQLLCQAPCARDAHIVVQSDRLSDHARITQTR